MNEQILNQRWKDIDKLLTEYLKEYQGLNRKTRDKLQDIFNSLDITYEDINKPIPATQKARLDRFIKELQDKGLLTSTYGYEARLILNKKSVTYAEMLSIMIRGVYIEENSLLLNSTNNMLYSVCEITYNQAITDIKPTKIVPFKLPIWYTIMNIPILGATYQSYLYALALTNADELYKKTLTNIQLQKKLDVDNSFYNDLFLKQNNRILGNTLKSGIVANLSEIMANESYLEAGKQHDVKKCRFIAEIDNRTTKMCETLDNQVFYLDEMNTYQRYSDVDKKIVTYHTKGMVLGENLPPINNHFHWCRSTITYMLDKDIEDMVRDNIKVANEYDKEQYSRYKKYFGDDVPNNVEDFTKMKYNNLDEWERLKENYFIEKKRYEIKHNLINTKIRVKKQNQHIFGEKMYIDGKSYFSLERNEVYQLIEETKGTGQLFKDSSGAYKEIVVSNKNIGHFINKKNNIDTVTDTYLIVYSKDGIHSYPISRRL